MKRVSYIITTKNRSKYLKSALANIREFITRKDELIIIDGGSKDGTKKLIQQNKDIVSYFESAKDYGEAHALNKGILYSSGKYIKILTDDDYIYPQAMRKAISVLEKNPEIDALQCGGEAYIRDETTGQDTLLFYEQVFPDVHIANNLLHVTTYCPCGLGLVLTRKVLSRTGLFDTTYRAVDLGYISKLILCKTNFKYLNISLYKHFNYAHSGENFANDIHRDEARVYVDHHMWEQALKTDTHVLANVLGLSTIDHGTKLLQTIKFFDFLRRKQIVIPVQILGTFATIGNAIIKLKHASSSQRIVIAKPSSVKPIEPKRDGTFW